MAAFSKLANGAFARGARIRDDWSDSSGLEQQAFAIAVSGAHKVPGIKARHDFCGRCQSRNDDIGARRIESRNAHAFLGG